jgi:hypothetical protein
MSHIVSIASKIHDPLAVANACRRLGLPEPAMGTAQLFSGEAPGLVVQLPGWEYPAVIDTLTGVIRYDNYGGVWGEQEQLDRFLQMYTVEKAKLEARKTNHRVVEEQLQDGSIKLHIQEAF